MKRSDQLEVAQLFLGVLGQHVLVVDRRREGDARRKQVSGDELAKALAFKKSNDVGVGAFHVKSRRRQTPTPRLEEACAREASASKSELRAEPGHDGRDVRPDVEESVERPPAFLDPSRHGEHRELPRLERAVEIVPIRAAC